MEKTICKTCKKVFYHWKHQNRKYCSVNCFRKAPKTFSHMTLKKEELYDLYFNKKLSFYKIEKMKNIPVNSIRYWFKKWGFKARSKSQAQKGVMNHSYKDGLKSNFERAYLRDKKKCVICGYNRFVEIHHIKSKKNKGKNNLNNLITLCANCHRLTHLNIIKIKNINEWKDNNKKYNRFKK